MEFLELGQYPARFEIQKRRLLYLKYILDQPEESLLKKLYNLQKSYPSRGDWASTCQDDLRKLEITLEQKEIQEMTKNEFKNFIKEKIRKHALNYLKGKQSKKGGQIQYNNLEMAEYLLPTCELNIKEKQKMFEIRNDMTKIPDNYGNESLCLCGKKEDMKHIYNCEIWNETKNEKIPYNNIYNGNIKKQIRILKIFEQNLEKRNKKMKIANSHEILIGSAVNPITNG